MSAENLEKAEAVEKLKELVDKIETFFKVAANAITGAGMDIGREGELDL